MTANLGPILGWRGKEWSERWDLNPRPLTPQISPAKISSSYRLKTERTPLFRSRLIQVNLGQPWAEVRVPAAVKRSSEINQMRSPTMAFEGIDALSRFVATPSQEK
jgi:hypothetical protein